MKMILWRLLLIAVLLILWEASAGTIANELFISRPSAVAEKFWELLTSGQIFLHGMVTIQETVLGFVIGAACGIMAGLLLGRSEFLAELLNPFLVAIYSLPKIALAPLFIMWFGIGLEMKIALIATIVFFLVFLNTYSGVRSVEAELTEILKLMGATERHIITKVVFPSAIQWVFTGLKLSVPYALIGAIVGEIMAGNRGLGYLLQEAAGQLDTGGVFAALVAIVFLALVLQTTVKYVEKKLMPWQPIAGEREVTV